MMKYSAKLFFNDPDYKTYIENISEKYVGDFMAIAVEWYRTLSSIELLPQLLVHSRLLYFTAA